MFEKIGGFQNINKLGFREPRPFAGVGVKVKLGMKKFILLSCMEQGVEMRFWDLLGVELKVGFFLLIEPG